MKKKTIPYIIVVSDILHFYIGCESNCFLIKKARDKPAISTKVIIMPRPKYPFITPITKNILSIPINTNNANIGESFKAGVKNITNPAINIKANHNTLADRPLNSEPVTKALSIKLLSLLPKSIASLVAFPVITPMALTLDMPKPLV